MFGGSGKNSGFIRTRISLTERLLSWLLLGLLGAVGVAIYLKGQRYDPGLFALDAASLSEAPLARVQQRLVDRADEGAVAGSAETPNGLLDGLAPDGWQPMGEVEQFSADDLFEKINGRAEQYLAYDVVGLTCLSLASPDGQFIDLFVYDMGKPLHAFGIFSVERAPDQPAVDLGRQGYRAEASYFFWKGPFYVQVLASDRGEELQQIAGIIARALNERMEDNGDELWGREVLPAADRVPGSLQYFKSDALSLDFLGNAYTAIYRRNSVEITAFLSRQDTPQAAGEVLQAYLSYLNDYGEVVDQRQVDGATLVVGAMSGFFDVVFQRGEIVGGVSMAENRTTAEKMASHLLENLQKR